MNKVYKIVWNESLGTWCAISEVSKTRGKRSSAKVTVAGVLLTVSALTMSSMAGAADQYVSINDGGTQGGNYNNDGATGKNALAVGVGASAVGENDIAIGLSAGVDNDGSWNTSVGSNSGQHTKGQKNTALGVGAGGNVTGNNNTGLGFDAGGTVRGDSNLAVGDLAGAKVTGSSNTALGKMSGFEVTGSANTATGLDSGRNVEGHNNSAFGVKSGNYVQGDSNLALGDSAGKNVTGNRNVALGRAAGQGLSNVDDATSLGSGAKAAVSNSVALGANSEAIRDVNSEVAYVPRGTTIVAANAEGGEVSVGTVGKERRMSNVAAASQDTDAVNLSQLKAVQAATTTHYFSVNDAGTQANNYNNDGATGKNALAVGVGASATGENAIAIGLSAGVDNDGDRNTSVGSNSGQHTKGQKNTALGVGAGGNVTGNNNTGLGVGAGGTVRGDSNLAVGESAGGKVRGGGNTALGKMSGFIVIGTANTATGQESGRNVEGDNNSAFGVKSGNNVQGDSNLALGDSAGENVTGNRNVALGRAAGQGLSNVDDATSLGSGAKAAVSNSVALGANSEAIRDVNSEVAYVPLGTTIVAANAAGGEVSVGTVGKERRISNVAAASQDTDAVNLSQLKAVQAATTTHYFSVNDAGIQGNNYNNDGATGKNALAVGVGAKAVGVNAIAIGNVSAGAINSIAIGNNNVLSNTASSSTAIGYNNNVTGNEAIALGANNTVKDFSGVAVGSYNNAEGYRSIAVGAENKTKGQWSSAFGVWNIADGERATVLGANNTVQGRRALGVGVANEISSTSEYSSAIGAFNKITDNTKSLTAGYLNTVTGGEKNSVLGNENTLNNAKNTTVLGNKNTVAQENTQVLGNNVKTTQANSVVLGNESTDRAATAVDKVTINGEDYAFAGVGSAANGVVSVGKVGGERQIINVAAGEVSASSTDAINGSQLHATNQAVEKLYAGAGDTTHYVSINDDGIQANNYNNDGATGVGAIAIGINTLASAESAIAIGDGTSVQGAYSNAIGRNNTIIGNLSTAMGNKNTVAQENTQVLGNNVTTTQANSVVLGNESTDRAATTIDKVTINGDEYAFAGVASAANGVVSVGKVGGERQIINVAAGEISANSTDAINGSQLHATNQAVEKLYAGAGDTTHYVSINDSGTKAGNYNNDGASGAFAVAVGVGASAKGDGATALGLNSSASAKDTVAIGADTRAELEGGVALGKGSVANTAAGIAGFDPLTGFGSINTGSAWRSSAAAFSVGDVSRGITRQITGVAAGTADTDAVNVAQLKAAMSKTNEAKGSTETVSAGKNTEVTKTTKADGSTDYQVATKDDVSFDSVTVGNIKADSQNNTISGLADGKVSADSDQAVNGSQLHDTAESVANALGGNAKVNPDGTIKTSNIGNTGKDNVHDAIASIHGQVAGAKTSVSAGKNTVVNSSTNADGSNNYQVALAEDIQLNSVTANQVTANQVTANKVNVGKVTIDGTTNKVSGLANGEITSTSTDAINGSQLHQTNSSVAQHLGGGSTLNKDGSIGAPTYNVAGGTFHNVGDALGAIDTRVSNLEQAFYDTNKNMDDLRNDTYAGIAGAMAVGNLPQPTEAGMSMVSAGVSGYRGETAVAIGVSAITDSNKIVWKMGASADSRSNIGGAVSMGYQWK